MGGFLKSLTSGLGSALSGVAGGLLGSVGSKAIDSLFGSDPNKQNMKIMQMQNDFNAQEAQKNRDFQVQMFDRTNEYNSPKAQMQRFMEAGLNPDLMYGGGASSISAQSPSGSQASGSSPIAAVDMQQRAANVALTQAQTRLIEHQADNLDADTNNKGADTDLKNAQTKLTLTENEFQQATMQGRIEYQNLTINLAKYDLENIKPAEWKVLTHTANKLSEECTNLQHTRDLIDKQKAAIGNDMYLKRCEMFLKAAETQARIKELAAHAHLMYKDAEALVLDTILKREAKDAGYNPYIENSKLSRNQASYYNVLGNRVQVDYDIDINGHSSPFTYRLAERDLQSAQNLTGSLNDLGQEFLFYWLAFGGKKPPKIGFR